MPYAKNPAKEAVALGRPALRVAFEAIGVTEFDSLAPAFYEQAQAGMMFVPDHPVYITRCGLLVRNWGSDDAPLLVVCGRYQARAWRQQKVFTKLSDDIRFISACAEIDNEFAMFLDRVLSEAEQAVAAR